MAEDNTPTNVVDDTKNHFGVPESEFDKPKKIVEGDFVKATTLEVKGGLHARPTGKLGKIANDSPIELFLKTPDGYTPFTVVNLWSQPGVRANPDINNIEVFIEKGDNANEVIDYFNKNAGVLFDADGYFAGTEAETSFKVLDTPTNVVDEVSKLQDALRNKYKNELDELYIIERPFYDPFKKINTDGIFIESIVIKPEFRGGGTGSKIIEEIQQFATENNLGIELEPDRQGGNQVRRFWENRGFVLQEYFDEVGNLITDDKELNNVYKWFPYNTDDYKPVVGMTGTIIEPTNVVDEGIELFHSTPSGNTPKNKIHFGNYNAALDRSSLQYGTSNMMNFITPEVINNAAIEIETALRSKLPDYMYVTEDSDEFINSGVDDFDEWFEETYGDTKQNLFEQDYQDLNGTTVDLRGSDVPLSMQNQSYGYYVIYEYSENSVGDITISISIAENQAIGENQLGLFSIDVEKGDYIGEGLLKENMPVQQLDDLKKINIVDEKDVEKLKNISTSVRENIVNQIQPQISKEIYENPGRLVSVIPNTEGYKFNTGYDLYKVNIKPNANILNISEPVIFNIEQADGTIKSIEMSPDIFVQTYEQSKSGMVNKFPSNIKEFVIDGKTINAEEFRANKGVLKAQILTTYIDDFDIVKYTNEVEGMITNPDGTVTFTDSYYAVNDNAIEINKVDNATNTKFNKESVKKVLQTGDYFTENTVQNINSPYYTTEELVNIVKTKDTPGGSLGAAKLNDPLVFDSWVDNLGNITTSFVDNLPLETVVKNRVKNLFAKKSAQVATPGGLMDFVDAWELAVLGLMAATVAFSEIDEVPTIVNNTAINMFNNMTSFYGIAPVPKQEYDLNYEFINKVLNTGEKFMPTDIIQKKGVKEFKEGQEAGIDISPGLGAQEGVFDNSITTPAKTDTMETTQKIQPGVQEEKMFEQAKPKKSKATGGAGAKIL